MYENGATFGRVPAIVLGFLLAAVVFPRLEILEMALLAATLAPTDAALGKPVVTNPAVPAAMREALNLESGLNDGICVPVVALLLGLAVGTQIGGGTLGNSRSGAGGSKRADRPESSPAGNAASSRSPGALSATSRTPRLFWLEKCTPNSLLGISTTCSGRKSNAWTVCRPTDTLRC
jgi:hypothetical protein